MFTKNEKLKKELKILTHSCTIEFKYILIKTASEFSYKPVQKVIQWFNTKVTWFFKTTFP